MDCKHQAKFSFKTLFSKKPTYTCKKCGVTIEMDPKTQNISRALNAILIAAMFFRVLSGKPAENVQGMFLSFGVLLLYILVYIILYFFLITFGKFVEVIPEEPITPIIDESTIDDAKSQSETDENAAKTEEDEAKEALSKEQQDLINLYNSYVPEDQKDADSDEQAKDQLSKDLNRLISDDCEHVPQKTWKNYIPSQFNFTCEKCGQPVTFDAKTKKSANLAIMAIIFVILMPSFMNTSVGHLQFIGLTALAIALSTVVQYYIVRKSKYIINTNPPKPRRQR